MRKQTAAVDGDGEISKTVLHGLERTNGNTELFAFLHIVNAKLFRCICDTNEGGSGEELPSVENGLEQ
ncbi:unannotated protein [freshwater metagenome]|uniref:Unannotated protein n=1 Tax=freshwater metagenome TaxID=449393 RepID=A0A6J6L3X7_9ZZZZ